MDNHVRYRPTDGVQPVGDVEDPRHLPALALPPPRPHQARRNVHEKLVVVVASVTIVLSAGFTFAEEDIAVVSGVSFCLSAPPGGGPLWGSAVANLVVRNSRTTSVWVLDPKTGSTGPPPVCRPGRFGSEWERGWKELRPGETWYTGWNVGSVWGGSLSFVGEHTLSMSSSLDLDGDCQAEHDVALSVTYRIVEPPAEVLTIAQERGVEVELCEADGAGGARVKAIGIPWQDLENEHQARVRESIALPIPSMTPEEIAKRGGRLPRPSDPDDQKRLEEALKTDPAYLRWEALRGKMGLYAGFDYTAALREIRLAWCAAQPPLGCRFALLPRHVRTWPRPARRAWSWRLATDTAHHRCLPRARQARSRRVPRRPGEGGAALR